MHFMKNSVKIFFGFCLLFSVQLGSCIDKKQPNIIVILSDDLNWNLPGFNGGTLVKSPNLDGLARDGVMLTQFYVQSVCSPTRACLMTGRYPFRTGVEERPHANDIAGMLTDERTLAEALSDAGYFTAIIGKWHLGGWKKVHLPMQRGFQYQYGHYSALIDYFTHERDEVLDWHRNEQPLKEEGYSTFLIADEVDRLIQAQDPSTPFFMYVPFNAVHGPMHAPEEYIEKYENTTSHIPPEYQAQFECMDIAIGRILESLDKNGYSDNTLVIFFNDNGGGKRIGNEPYRGGKGDYYEGGLRVPCIIRWPGHIKPGTKIDEALHVVDLYPTLINIAGGVLEQELPVDGLDAWNTISKEESMQREEIIHCLEVTRDIGRPAPGALRKGDYKLVGDQLFNIRKDPYEKKDLAQRHPEKVAQMKARLKELALERRQGEEHLPIPGYPPAVYGEEENSNYTK